MTETLSVFFQKSQGKPVEYDGRVVQPILKLKFNESRKDLIIRRIKAIKSPEQGIRIKVEKGYIEVNNQRHSEILLWTDSSPEVVMLSVVSKGNCEIKLWNIWRAGDIVQAWIGNAGMVITDHDSFLRFECSDGNAAVSFTDLVFEVDIKCWW